MTTKKVKISDVALGPIRHQTLPAELLTRIKTFKQILGDLEPASLEQTIDNFKRDAHPEREVAVWERIANTCQAFISRHNITDSQPRRDVYAALLAISIGADDFSNIHTLASEQITELQYNF